MSSGTFARQILFDAQGTFSLGRLMAVAFGVTGLTVLWVLLALVVYIVLTHQMGEAAPFAAAVGAPLVAALGAPALGTVALYWVQKKLPGGGATVAQASTEASVVQSVEGANPAEGRVLDTGPVVESEGA